MLYLALRCRPLPAAGPSARVERPFALRNWLVALKLLAGAALIYLILRRVDAHQISGIMLGARPGPLALACLFIAGAVVSNAYRWRSITRCLDHGVSGRTAVIGYFESMFFNQILPTGIGGDAIRVVRAYDAGVMAGWALVGVLIDRAFGLLAVGVVLVFAYLVGGSPITAAPLFAWLAAVALVVVLGAGVAVWLGAIVRQERLPRWTAPFVSLLQAFTRVFRSSGGMTEVLLTLMVSTVLMAASLVACARSVGVDLGFWDGLIVMQGILLAALVPISIGGWGVREGALILLFAPLGIGADQAVAISVLFGLALTAIGLAGAVVWLASGYRRVDLAMRLGAIRRKSSGGAP